MKRCRTCLVEKAADEFYATKARCKTCMRAQARDGYTTAARKYVRRPRRHRVDDDGRECSRCREYRPWVDYNKGNGARSHSSWCRSCAKAHHYQKPASSRRAYGLKSRLRMFGLTVEQFQILEARFDGCCWRCKKPEVRKGPGGKIQRLSIDHDHACCPGDGSCGKCIRGLLCVGCNFVLGRIDGGQVDSYIAYLAKGRLDLDLI